MTDRSAPPGVADEPASGGDAAPSSIAAGRVRALWHRVRSGEDPVAFGAVVVLLALAAGVLWFWAGARHGGVEVASASPGRSEERAGRPGAGTAPRSPDTAGRAGAGAARSADTAVPPAGDSEATPSGAAAAASAATGPPMAVHVAGAVVHPGLYHLPPGSRVADAVTLAGGRMPRADLDRLNLAARLVDGERVYVTRRGEPSPPEPAGPGIGNGGGDDQGVLEPSEPVDLNGAGLAALDSLPGVGPATARAILEERARRGGFRSTRDLLRVPGIGEGRFARLKDHVRV